MCGRSTVPGGTPWVPVGGWSVQMPGLSPADPPGEDDDATRLALRAVHRALGLPPGRSAEPPGDASGTAVVVASNLGTVKAVCGMLGQPRDHGIAPNTSGNAIASSVGVRYGFTGPNLTVSSGATAGLDAIRLGTLLLRAGRARRTVVVGAEPADPVARALAALRPDPPGELTAGAGCVLLGQWPRPTGLWCGPVQRHTVPALMTPARTGELYGAAGVVRLAIAAARLAYGGGYDSPRGSPPGSSASFDIGCGDPEDGYATVRLLAGTPASRT